ncbi:MAG: L,D-transpeptidase [Gemmatimonadaceae bacterium]|nr:L,D-transpeptidase [Acetobacteraceae bacterium]
MPDAGAQIASPPVQALARWASGDGDAAKRPFAVVDKPAARIFVFAADGRLVASAPVLLGLARGDMSAPGVGNRVLSGIPVHERTTPAGRFNSEPGRNLQGEAVVWVDYHAAVAIHRLRPAAAKERRPQRLASPTADDNRITLGCIVVDAVFYDGVVAPLLGRGRGVVYVLPDTQDWRDLFRDAAGL